MSRITQDPHSSFSHREMFREIKEGTISVHEFGDWFVNRLVDASIKAMEQEKEFAQQEKKRGAFSVPV